MTIVIVLIELLLFWQGEGTPV